MTQNEFVKTKKHPEGPAPIARKTWLLVLGFQGLLSLFFSAIVGFKLRTILEEQAESVANVFLESENANFLQGNWVSGLSRLEGYVLTDSKVFSGFKLLETNFVSGEESRVVFQVGDSFLISKMIFESGFLNSELGASPKLNSRWVPMKFRQSFFSAIWVLRNSEFPNRAAIFFSAGENLRKEVLKACFWVFFINSIISFCFLNIGIRMRKSALQELLKLFRWVQREKGDGLSLEIKKRWRQFVTEQERNHFILDEAEENFRLLQRSKHFENEVDQFLHDIRSPITALVVVQKNLKGLPAENQNLFREALDRGREIISDLETNSAKQKKDTAQNNMVCEVYELAFQVVREKRLHCPFVEFHFEGDQRALERVQVFLNPISFQRLISNLLNNAIEACSEPNSKVQLKLAVSSENQKVLVQIEDNGKGMDSAQLESLGKRGFTQGKLGGTGLGFFFAHEMIKAWGGTLSVSSEVGKGTQVILELPQRN